MLDSHGQRPGRWNSKSIPGTFAAWSSGKPVGVYVSEVSFVDPTVLAQTSGSCGGGIWQNGAVDLQWATEGTVGLTTPHGGYA